MVIARLCDFVKGKRPFPPPKTWLHKSGAQSGLQNANAHISWWRRLATHPPRNVMAIRLRAKHVAPSFSTSYASSPSGPIHMVRGVGCRLWDARGLQYLDCVNNVSHVGHAHPRVTQAASEQLALLNTNTRYLSQSLVEYAKALTGRLHLPTVMHTSLPIVLWLHMNLP